MTDATFPSFSGPETAETGGEYDIGSHFNTYVGGDSNAIVATVILAIDAVLVTLVIVSVEQRRLAEPADDNARLYDGVGDERARQTATLA